ncbi:MAG: hypothetical protein QOF11_2694 [Chloroflexota bacterium]|jgi:hypothetical protein|nr:hypothetical protein [Chloroflexota bacterium]
MNDLSQPNRILVFWLVASLAPVIYNVSLSYLAGGWPGVRSDRWFLVRESVLYAAVLALLLVAYVLLGTEPVVVAIIVGVVAFRVGQYLWRRDHPLASLTGRRLARREAERSRKGKLLLNGFFVVTFIGGWVMLSWIGFY